LANSVKNSAHEFKINVYVLCGFHQTDYHAASGRPMDRISRLSVGPSVCLFVTFGGKQPLCTLTLDGVKFVNLEWCDKLKYLGCYFKSNSCHSDITHRIRNFYGCLNNILSVLGKGKNEITAVRLVRTYCIPILTYGSEIWHITESEKRSLNVLWNNTFRKIFNCCWRESPFSLQFYTGCLPMHLIIEQQMVLFYRRVLRSSNVILQTLSLYKIRSLNVSCDTIKQCIWHYNVRNAVDSGRLTLL